VHGGGVLSSWVIGHTDRFAAAAVRCPVIDWISMAGHTDIPLFTYNFFDRPFWEDPQPWLRQSSLMYVGNVHTPTLLMTGELDMRTPMPQSEEYFAALRIAPRAHRAAPLNGEYHGTGSKPVELSAHPAVHAELVPALAATARTPDPASGGGGEPLGLCAAA